MYLCVDIGTSSVKAALVREDGHHELRARSPIELRHEGRSAHETDPRQWISALASMAAALPRELLSSVRAIAVSGNGPTLIAADGRGEPVGPALSWMDKRAVAEAAELAALAGHPVDPSFYLPKALWLHRHDARVRERGRWFFSCPEYVAFRLTGEAVTYLPDPGYQPFIWEPGLAEKAGLPAERFPPYIAHGRVLGETQAGNPASLPAGIPVVAAFPDFLASVLGSAVVEPGTACDRSGTSEAVNFCSSAPFPDGRMFSLPHPVPGLWNVSGGLSTSGKALEWFASVAGLASSGDGPRDGEGSTPAWKRPEPEGLFGLTGAVIALARESVPGANGALFVPYLAGERAPLWDSALRGSFHGLSVEHARADLARAVVEGCCYALRLVLDTARSGGLEASVIRASGVLASDAFLGALKSDILGVPFELPETPESELSGDACACAVGLGDEPDFQAASKRLYHVARHVEPERKHAPTYEARYAEFLAALAAQGAKGNARR